MYFAYLTSRRFLKPLLALALTTGSLHSAPYGPQGMEIEWTQPNGAKLSLRVFGDEFYARTETTDGFTVVFDPATKSYYYAEVSADGQDLVSTGVAVGAKNPQTLGLAQHLVIDPAAAKAKALVRFQEWDQATENSQRWSQIKAQRNAYDQAVEQAKEEGGPMPAPPSFTTIGNKVGTHPAHRFLRRPRHHPAGQHHRLLQRRQLHRLRQQRLGQEILPGQFQQPPDLHQHRHRLHPDGAAENLLQRHQQGCRTARAVC